MAGVKPPKPFDPGTQPSQNWERWRERYVHYELAVDMDEKPVLKQIAHLLHNIGETGLAVYQVLKPDLPAEKTTTDILDAISKHYTPYKNTTYIRYLFFSENQGENQTIDDYVLSLRTKVQNCEFGGLTDSLIKDRLIGGIRDSHMRERLLKDHNMTLDKAINLCRADENSKQQSLAMTNNEASAVGIHKLSSKEYQKHAKKSSKFKSKSEHNKQDRSKHYNTEKTHKCSRCGTRHISGSCPAYGQVCHKCKRKNHYATVCRAQNTIGVHTVGENNSTSNSSGSDSEFHIDTLKVDSMGKGAEWFHKVQLQNIKLKFKLDTGSEVNLISDKIYEKLTPRPQLTSAIKKVTAYTGHPVPVLGKCILTCTDRDHTIDLDFYVASTQEGPPILGLQACVALKLIARLHALPTQTRPAKEIVDQYEDVFHGMGKLLDTHDIKLVEGATPQIVPARKIPISLRNKVKAELDRMVENSVIVPEN